MLLKDMTKNEKAYALFVMAIVFIGMFGGNENFIPSTKWSSQGGILGLILCVSLFVPIALSKRLIDYPNKLASNGFRVFVFLLIWFGSWRVMVFDLPTLFVDLSKEKEIISTEITQKVRGRSKLIQCQKRLDTKASKSFIHGELCVPGTFWEKVEKGQIIYLVGVNSEFGFSITEFRLSSS